MSVEKRIQSPLFYQLLLFSTLFFWPISLQLFLSSVSTFYYNRFSSISYGVVLLFLLGIFVFSGPIFFRFLPFRIFSPVVRFSLFTGVVLGFFFLMAFWRDAVPFAWSSAVFLFVTTGMLWRVLSEAEFQLSPLSYSLFSVVGLFTFGISYYFSGGLLPLFLEFGIFGLLAALFIALAPFIFPLFLGGKGGEKGGAKSPLDSEVSGKSDKMGSVRGEVYRAGWRKGVFFLGLAIFPLFVSVGLIASNFALWGGVDGDFHPLYFGLFAGLGWGIGFLSIVLAEKFVFLSIFFRLFWVIAVVLGFSSVIPLFNFSGVGSLLSIFLVWFGISVSLFYIFSLLGGGNSELFFIGFIFGEILSIGALGSFLLYGWKWSFVVLSIMPLFPIVLSLGKLGRGNFSDILGELRSDGFALGIGLSLFFILLSVVSEKPFQALGGKDSKGVLSVLSANVRYGWTGREEFRPGASIEWIAGLPIEPDIVGFQEITRGNHAAGGNDLFEYYRYRLKGFWIYGNSDFGFGNALFSRFKVLKWRVYPFRSKVIMGRSYLWVLVQVGGRQVEIINTHLEYRPPPSPVRMAQVRELVERLRVTSRPWILLGDFNAGPSSEEVRSLLSLSSPVFLRDKRLLGGETYPSLKPKKRIDYIFWSHHFKLLQFKVLDNRGKSDHRPVWAALELREN